MTTPSKARIMGIAILIPFLSACLCCRTPLSEIGRHPAWEETVPKGAIYQNGLGMTFVRIEPGRFFMGSSLSEEGRGGDEREHPVTLSQAFYMQTTEVTQGQWTEVMGYNPSYFNQCGENCPVEYISWNDTQAFIKRLNELAGENRYRLPTEAEWEYVCRAGQSSPFCFGKDKEQIGEHAWYKNNSQGTTHPVAGKKPNSWGVYDMHGNVFEWCGDWYGAYPESFGNKEETQNASPKRSRSVRGGSWDDRAFDCRSASRSYCAPGFGNFYIGFRLVMVP